MKVTRTGSFIKPRVGLIFFTIDSTYSFDPFAVDLYDHKSWYTKYTKTGKSDKNHNDKNGENKYVIDEVLEKDNGTSSIPIVRIKDTFLLIIAFGIWKIHAMTMELNQF